MAPTKPKLSKKSRKTIRHSSAFPTTSRSGDAANRSCLCQSLRLSPCPDDHGQRSKLCRAFKRLLRVAKPEHHTSAPVEMDQQKTGNSGAIPDNLRGPYFVAYNFIVGAVDGARSRAASMEGVAEDMPLPVMEQHPCPGPSGQCRSIPSLGHLNTPLLRRRLRRQLKKDPVIHLDPADLPAVDGGPNLNVISHNSVTTIVRGGKAFDIVFD